MPIERRLYAGIGSRQAPKSELIKATKVAQWLRKRDFTLRSGGADGMDEAFASGAGSHAEIFFASCPRLRARCRVGQRCSCVIPDEAFEVASRLHPAWNRLSSYVRRLHARNVQILLGQNLDKPVEFVLLWSRFDKLRGGTAFGWKLAEHYGIPVVSLKDSNAARQIAELVYYNVLGDAR